MGICLLEVKFGLVRIGDNVSKIGDIFVEVGENGRWYLL